MSRGVWKPTVRPMSIPLEPRLDEFERRLRELETELAELRALTAGTAPTAPVATTLPASIEVNEPGSPRRSGPRNWWQGSCR